MKLPFVFCTIPSQFHANWQLDGLSLLLGLTAGLLLFMAIRRLMPYLTNSRDRALGRVRHTYARVRSGVEGRFQEEMLAYVRHYHLAGQRATLDQLFVPPRLLAPMGDEEAIDGRSLASFARLWPDLAATVSLPLLPTVSLRELLLNGRRVAVTGGSGSGKTTLLAYCTHLCATAAVDDEYGFLNPFLPLFVHVAELDLALAERGSAAPLQQALQRRAGVFTATGLAELVEQRLAAGSAWLMLDGVAECQHGERPAVYDWLGRLLADYPEIRVMVATGEGGYGPLLEQAFVPVELAPYWAGEAELLGRQWAAAFVEVTPPLEQYWRPGQSVMLTALRLWLLFAGRTTPDTVRTGEGLAAGVENWVAIAAGANPALEPLLHAFLAQLAYVMVNSGRPRLGQAELTALAERLVTEHEGGDRLDGDGLLLRLNRTGPLLSGPDGACRFLMPAWRDFLAAAYLAETGQVHLAHGQLDNPDWAGLLRFLAGRADVTSLVEQLVVADGGDEGLHEGLFQAASWFPELSGVVEWRRHLLVALGQLVMNRNAPAGGRWRAAALMAAANDVGVIAFVRQLAQQTEPFLRQLAASIAVRLPPVQAVELLEKLLADKESKVRQVAVYSMAWLQDPAAERPLLLVLLGDDPQLSQIAATLMALKGEAAHEILREAVTDSLVRVRRAAVHGLARLEAPWVEPLLRQLAVEDPEWVVRTAAELALAARDADDSTTSWQPRRTNDLAWLQQWATDRGRPLPSGPELISLFNHLLIQGESAALRVNAAQALGRLALRPGVACLQAALQDNDPAVRDAAFMALSLIRRAYAGLPEGAQTLA